MNDNELITNDMVTTVREPFAQIRMATPVEAVVARGRSIRQRRRLGGVTGVAAAVAGAAALVTFAASPGAHPTPVKLAAWTVITEPNGTVAVTIHDLRDPAGLQRALQAHGVPAIVRFHGNGALMPSCVTSVPSKLATIEGRVFLPPPTGSHDRALGYINPAAIPRTDKIAIDAVRGNGFSIGLVTHDGRCPPGSSLGGLQMRHS